MKVVADRYQVIRELGRGGMGVVWLAEDRVIGRQVALKELRTSSPAERERVLREARTAGRLNSPSVVTVHDVVVEEGTAYIVMELVSAPTLADLMPLPADRVAAIGLAVLDALDTAHAAGIVHRDVKPGNVMVLPNGQVKLADFGIARAMDDPRLTANGGVMGSPGYMAPELFAGQPPAPPSDMWALGATLFEAVEGRSPFERATTAATVHAVLNERPVPTHLAGPLSEVVLGLLVQAPANRFTAQQARAGLQRAASADAETVVFPKADNGRDVRKIALAGGGVAAVLALTAAFVLIPDDDPGERAMASTPSPVSSTSAPPSSSTAPSSSAPPSSSTPTTTTTTVVAPPRLVPLARFKGQDNWSYTGSSMLDVPMGYAPDKALGLVLTRQEEGTRPLYSCQVKDSPGRMTSLSATCETQRVYGIVGYVYEKQPPADKPSQELFRCKAGDRHFDSNEKHCDGQQVEFSLGWVLVDREQ
ncbi:MULTISPECIES: serine/threonine-protein kinase [Actinosynnema]|uniref:serine/threonine-protein kinase n=1 Tax=Actinosynnema TaxID=40566 RepID=UPI0027E38ACB|nr:serine/threonine-protein kinase [Actinosynnema pretiosum]MCP2093991.1 Serine/threonine protein kinase [Actinosynnema pretiosum]